MTYFQAIFLGIIQGLTEFLPVSSSGHLVLFEHFLNINFDETMLKGFDVILHCGTLLAIIFYFQKDLKQLWQGFVEAVQTKTCNANARVVRNLFLATVPALFVGFFWNDFLDENFRNVKAVGAMLILTGMLLFLGEKFPKQKKQTAINLKQSFFIGCAQAIALIPGISRSGSTISVAMLQGINRETAARFSFLMAIPAISAATGYVLLKAFLGEIFFPAFSILLIGFLTSFLSSYLCVKFLMQFIRKHSLSVFSYYLFVVGLFLILS